MDGSTGHDTVLHAMLHLQLSGSSEQLPVLDLKVDGVVYSFLVDSGATRSSLSGNIYNGPVSAASISTVGIGGKPVQCPITHTLPTHTQTGGQTGEIFMHPFIIIPNSPVNLLGRDLMAKMNMSFSFTSKGGMIIGTGSTQTCLSAVSLPCDSPQQPVSLDRSACLELNQMLATLPRHSLCKHEVLTPLPLHTGTRSMAVLSVTCFNNMIVAHTSDGDDIILSQNSDVPFDIAAKHSTHQCIYPIACVITAVALTPQLEQLPLWSQGEHDVGHVDCTPYRAKLRHDEPVFVKQYPLSYEKTEGLRPIISDLLKSGVIIPTTSPYNTPVNPVPKPRRLNEWRFTQDLRRINDIIVPLPPLVPDVPAIITAIPASATCFTVIDLCAAFFSIPVHPDSQKLFAFTFEGKQYTWTRLPQGMVDSPSAFSMATRATLSSFQAPHGTVLIQYVDDILLCADTEAQCQDASVKLLHHLQDAGHKASLKKLQYCLPQVNYLGFLLSHGSRTLTPDRVTAIQAVPPPQTPKEMMSFLGLVNYCRQWIPDCSHHDSVLRSACKKDSPPQVQWTPQMSDSFQQLKDSLCSAPSLGLPDYALPFHLYVTENGTTCAAVLAQDHGGGYRPTAYLSKTLPAVVQGMPVCLRAVAACAMMVQDACRMTLSHTLILHTTHQVNTILHNCTTQHMTAQRRSGYEAILTATTNLTI